MNEADVTAAAVYLHGDSCPIVVRGMRPQQVLAKLADMTEFAAGQGADVNSYFLSLPGSIGPCFIRPASVAAVLPVAREDGDDA